MNGSGGATGFGGGSTFASTGGGGGGVQLWLPNRTCSVSSTPPISSLRARSGKIAGGDAGAATVLAGTPGLSLRSVGATNVTPDGSLPNQFSHTAARNMTPNVACRAFMET
ncbi:hypothetical protein PPGU16_60960 (plasmid) [Paraburkholderia largidicola]|uniref:Uncharacterized protein n=1 Tax=Paraburkholderia largidicola TaxID=3014751 RepID=A0A7I8BXD0_9BURK|nr:hypothetical protein PPGU16_60960 [Paraburkholderia sp. PGU16]